MRSINLFSKKVLIGILFCLLFNSNNLLKASVDQLTDNETFSRKSFDKIDSLGTLIRSSRFKYSIFNDCNFRAAGFANCTFLNSEILSCNFKEARIINTTFSAKYNVKVTASKFNKALVSGCRFKNIIFDNISFVKTDIRDSVFEDCEFIGVDFEMVRFNDVTFKSCTFYTQKWDNPCRNLELAGEINSLKFDSCAFVKKINILPNMLDQKGLHNFILPKDFRLAYLLDGLGAEFINHKGGIAVKLTEIRPKDGIRYGSRSFASACLAAAGSSTAKKCLKKKKEKEEKKEEETESNDVEIGSDRAEKSSVVADIANGVVCTVAGSVTSVLGSIKVFLGSHFGWCSSVAVKKSVFSVAAKKSVFAVGVKTVGGTSATILGMPAAVVIVGGIAIIGGGVGLYAFIKIKQNKKAKRAKQKSN